jgi:plasmid maintenance system antidote protein VapI
MYGYQQVVLCNGGKRKVALVHLVVLLAFVGPLPTGQETRHLNGVRDDNRLENLCYGTREENHQDNLDNGAFVVGEEHGRAKLTEDQVKEIIRLRMEGMSSFYLAPRFGVNDATISNILTGRTWAHVSRPEKYPPIKDRRRRQTYKINEESVRRIMDLYNDGWTQTDIAAEIGVSIASISNVVTGKTWSYVTGIVHGS